MTEEAESFLNELQLEGRATNPNAVEYMSIEEAMEQVNKISNQEAIDLFKTTDKENWPTIKMAIYCHDCRQIVSAGMGKTLRGNPRTVCGKCKSKKISSGTFEGLRRFYHLNEEGKREKKPAN